MNHVGPTIRTGGSILNQWTCNSCSYCNTTKSYNGDNDYRIVVAICKHPFIVGDNTFFGTEKRTLEHSGKDVLTPTDCPAKPKPVVTQPDYSTVEREFDDDDENFERCSGCDGHDACADFGCAIQNGLAHLVKTDHSFLP